MAEDRNLERAIAHSLIAMLHGWAVKARASQYPTSVVLMPNMLLVTAQDRHGQIRSQFSVDLKLIVSQGPKIVDDTIDRVNAAVREEMRKAGRGGS